MGRHFADRDSFARAHLTILTVAMLCAVAGQAVGAQQAGDGSALVKVRVPAGADDALAGRRIADYGAFSVFEVASDAIPLADGVEVIADGNRIMLNSGVLDTTQAEIKALQTPRGEFVGKAMQLVQFSGPIKPEWVAALEETGAEIVTYLPSNTYLIYGDSNVIARVQRLAGAMREIQWNGAYQAEHRVAPAAAALAQDPETALAEDIAFSIQLIRDPEMNKSTLGLIDSLRTGKVVTEYDALNCHNITVPITPADIYTIAAQGDVVSIHRYVVPRKNGERQDQIIAGNISSNSPSGPGYLAWLTSKGFTQAQFTASNFSVDVTDSGIDNGTTSPNHFGLRQGGVIGGTSRVVYNRLVGTANSGSTVKGCDGHGTINAHIVSGYSNMSGSPHVDSAGYRYGLGVCPFVKTGSSVIFDPDYFTSPNYLNLQSMAYNNGARISTNSWGANTYGAYDTDAQTYDSLVRDAQPTGSTNAAAGNQQMVIVFAAGNAGSSSGSVGSPGTAKNVITVGAAENVQSFGGNDGCSTTDTEANSINDIVGFSSRGPCDDGRKKPDIMAPGTHISGGVAQASAVSTGNGVADSCYTGDGVCGGVSSNYYPSSGQQFYTASSGTSHSTPAVAGGAALVRQFFINQGLTPPSPAMTKAILMNSARYMNGTGANDTLYSNNQGMGEMNLGELFDRVATTPTVIADQTDLLTASGQTRMFAGSISSSAKPFRVTLAWTDAPGATSGAAYKNNLDLLVTINGTTYKGNVFSGANSVTGGSADSANNVESVFIPAGVSGTYTVTVTAANINSDGVPATGTSLDQDFALVIYNASTGPFVGLNGTGADTIADNVGNGNNNTRIDPGESAIQLSVPINNIGNIAATGVSATLVSTTPTVTVASAASSYPNLAASGGAGSNASPYVINVSPSHVCGDPISLRLNITSAQGTGIYNFSLATGQVAVGSGTPTTYTYSGSPVSIPDNNSSGASANLAISGATGTISDVNVRFNGSSCNANEGSTTVGLDHTYLGDLVISLQSPSGTVVTLSDRNGSGGNNLCNTIFDDSASSPFSSISSSGAPWTGTYSPDSPLAAFNGQSANGTWTLKVVDEAGVDVGNIRAFSIIVTTTLPNTCDLPGSACPECAADYDGNGGVDGGDLAAFFTDFENGEGCADVDNNGGVDGGDLSHFFQVFEDGGC